MDNYVQLHLKASKTDPSRYGNKYTVVQIKQLFEIMSFHFTNTAKCRFSFFALILTKALLKRVFFSFIFFCPYSNQSPSTKGDLLSFCLILTKPLPQRV